METDERNKGGPVETDGEPGHNETEDTTADPAKMLREIVSRGYEFDFFQLVRLLEGILERDDGSSTAPARGLRFRPSRSVVFPATDVKRVVWSGSASDPVEVVASFMGLYGFASPLPSHYGRGLEQDLPSARPLQSFLDMFNHRLYAYFFQAWLKYRPWMGVGRADQAHEDTRMRALSGLGSPGTHADDAVSDPTLTTFAGQLGGVVRNANGLLNLLRATFPDVHVQIEENVPRWVFFSERAVIGRAAFGGGARLGANAAIGEKVKDLSGKFRINLGPLELDRFESCLPGGTGADAIQKVVDAYVTDFLDYDVELVVQVEDIPPMALGERRRRLGLNTWLGRPIPRYSRRLVHYGQAVAPGSTPN